MTIEGVVPILLTPFDEREELDEESLARLVELNIEAGVHGLGLALGSEIFKLTEAERERLVRATVAAVAGRVPLVVNTGAAGTAVAVHHSRAAAAAGADALMIMPPSFMPAGAAEILDYYRRIARAVELPIVLQDTPLAPVPPELALRIADECPNVLYVKVERAPVVHAVAQMASAAGDRLTIFGGAGGDNFIEELRRGSRGTMPFATQPAAFVDVWSRFAAGDEAGARAVFDSTIAPLCRVAAQTGFAYHVHKHLLVRLGVFRTATVRSPAPTIDELTQQELDALLDELYPPGSTR